MGRLTPIIVVNALLALVFLISNYGIWSTFNNQYFIIGSVHFDPIWIQFDHRMAFTAGKWIDLNGVVSKFNLPFWLFFIALAINLYFISKLCKR